MRRKRNGRNATSEGLLGSRFNQENLTTCHFHIRQIRRVRSNSRLCDTRDRDIDLARGRRGLNLSSPPPVCHVFFGTHWHSLALTHNSQSFISILILRNERRDESTASCQRGVSPVLLEYNYPLADAEVRVQEGIQAVSSIHE
ncbi:hypothetical protein RRG08_022150 [Elysia crispata]|uniref:Uncharacterized protein n=1 Tax=Elysia crispata TaxID=231223 RepID=A0AAE1AJE7_9GAST|nr:hypothetical protein RRG08_022150 [Elysia crispata]